MIPGKLFFQSINITQQLSSKYEIHLILNGIYYDKIKLFQTKYLCLTVNDQLEIQLHVDLRDNSYSKSGQTNKDVREVVYNFQSNQRGSSLSTATNFQHNYHYLKTLIPQPYKLMIQSKTIDVKFKFFMENNGPNLNTHGNSKIEQIQVNLLFQTVATFNRRKLGALGSPVKRKDHQGSIGLDSLYLNNSNSGKRNKMDTLTDKENENHSPQGKWKVDNSGIRLKKSQRQVSQVNSSQMTLRLNKINQGERSYDKYSLKQVIKPQHLIQESISQIQIDNENSQIPPSQITNSQNVAYIFTDPRKKKATSKKNLTQKQQSQFNQTQILQDKNMKLNFYNGNNNFDLFSSQQNPMNYPQTTRTHGQFVGGQRTRNDSNFQANNEQDECYENQNGDQIIENQQQDYQREGKSKKAFTQTRQIQKRRYQQQDQYSSVDNYRSNNEMPSQLDTLESLAYQRQKILGQLFGKFNNKSVK